MGWRECQERKLYIQKTQKIFYLPQINQSPTLAAVGENILHDTIDIAYQFRNDAEDGNEDENENPGEAVIQKGKQMQT